MGKFLISQLNQDTSKKISVISRRCFKIIATAILVRTFFQSLIVILNESEESGERPKQLGDCYNNEKVIILLCPFGAKLFNLFTDFRHFQS